MKFLYESSMEKYNFESKFIYGSSMDCIMEKYKCEYCGSTSFGVCICNTIANTLTWNMKNMKNMFEFKEEIKNKTKKNGKTSDKILIAKTRELKSICLSELLVFTSRV